MAHTPHELAAEFPEHIAKISELKQVNTHFARLADAYHDVNRTVHRVETNLEPMGDIETIALRKKRAALKDKIYRLLTA